MEFITNLAGLGLQFYQIDQQNDRLSRERENRFAITSQENASRNRAMLIGGAVIVVLGLAYLKNKK